MQYLVNKNDKMYYYDVNYDPNKLVDILSELEDLTYEKKDKMKSSGRNASMFDSDKKMKDYARRSSINLFKRYGTYVGDFTVLENSEVFTLEKDGFNKYYDYEISILYSRYTNLYRYIEFILYDFDYIDNKHWFKGVKNNGLSKHNLLMDAILYYEDTEEFKTLEKNKDFDLKKLLELHSKLLKCLNFKLVAIKENINEEIIEDGFSIKRK